jgi:hypothetical protein
MLRRIISVVIGVIIGIVIIFIGDSVCMRLHSPPPGLNPMDLVNFNAYVNSIPSYVMAIMFFFWMLSTFLGGMVAALINQPGWKNSALITGSILLAASILNMINISHPMWMVVAAVIFYIPMAYLGALIVSKSRDKQLNP